MQEEMTPEQFKTAQRELWTEEDFQKKVVNLARQCGWKVAHFRKVRVQRKNGSTYWETPVAADGKGWPDLAFARNSDRADAGYFMAELKVGKNKLTTEQKAWMRLLDLVDVETHVWQPSDWDEIVERLK